MVSVAGRCCATSAKPYGFTHTTSWPFEITAVMAAMCELARISSSRCSNSAMEAAGVDVILSPPHPAARTNTARDGSVDRDVTRLARGSLLYTNAETVMRVASKLHAAAQPK